MEGIGTDNGKREDYRVRTVKNDTSVEETISEEETYSDNPRVDRIEM